MAKQAKRLTRKQKIELAKKAAEDAKASSDQKQDS